ncbi:MAG: NAD-dependent epimerase/dehydratase family protein [Desulfobacterales bacterium]|nr:NAD-dependent epimerase/dehydratase family protein [Desulfobacterales bacterium]
MQASDTNILVTGATGLIGARLVKELLLHGHGVRALTRREDGDLPRGVQRFVGDITDPASLQGIAEGITTVVHCAGLLGKWRTDYATLYDVNVQGSINLLERFAASALERFIHISAAGVTGPLQQAGEADETYPCRPATPYEKAKLVAEKQVAGRAAQLGIDALVVRPTFTYGAGDTHKLPLFRAVKKGRMIFLNGGASVNTPVYVDDVVSGIRLAMQHGKRGAIYIIGGQRPVTKKELINTIADTLDVGRPRISIPRGLAAPGATVLEALGRIFDFEPMLTRGKVMMMADNFGYSIKKAQQELHYCPLVDLRQGICMTINDYIARGWL